MANRVELPDKLYFKIGEVARIADVKQHVLRYWESEFAAIKPTKSKTNQRLYRRKDVEVVLAIKHLLYDRKFTIEGARRHLKEDGLEDSLPPADPEVVAQAARKEVMDQMKDEVEKAKWGESDWYEKKLLALRAEIEKFIEELDLVD